MKVVGMWGLDMDMDLFGLRQEYAMDREINGGILYGEKFIPWFSNLA